ncbi:MAG: TolC family protein [Elusimicrobia bacterium]|nr:TolC family protein [Candidatus Liberimonas magnetica]
MKKIVLLTAVIIACRILCHSAENAAPSALTLKGCLDLSEKKSEVLKIEFERQKQMLYRLNQARGTVLPAIDYRYLKTYRDTSGGFYDGEQADSRFNISQPIFNGFKNSYGIKAAKSLVTKEELLYKVLYKDFEVSVTQSFYTVIQLQADIQNIQSSEKLLQDRIIELNERVRLGKSRESEVLAVESQIATLKAQEESRKGNLANALESLSFLTGIDSSELNIIDDSSGVQDLEILEKYIAKVNDWPEIEAARQDIVFQTNAVNIAKGSRLPSLDLDGSYYTNRSGSLSSSNWEALFTFDMPLFQGGIIKGKLNEESSILNQYEQALSLAQRQATSLVKKLYQAAVSSLGQVSAYKDAYEKAQKSYQIQLKDYRFGLVNNLDVLQAMTAMLDAKRSYDKALVQAKIDKANLEIATKN